MEGSVLSFLRAEWKVSDTGSALCWASSLFFCQSIRAFSITFVSFSVSPSGHSVLPLSLFLSWQGIQYYPCLFFCRDRAFSITLVQFSVMTGHSVLPLSIFLSWQAIQYYLCLFFSHDKPFNIIIILVYFSVVTGHSVLPLALSIFLSWQAIQYYPCLFFCQFFPTTTVVCLLVSICPNYYCSLFIGAWLS